MDVAPATLAEQVAEQVGELSRIAEAEGVRVSYVKPHGALYNRVVDDEEQAAAVLAGVGRPAGAGPAGRRAAAAGGGRPGAGW